MQMEQTECSETWAHKIHTPGNYPEESIQHSGTCFKTMKSLDISGFLADILTRRFLQWTFRLLNLAIQVWPVLRRMSVNNGLDTYTGTALSTRTVTVSWQSSMFARSAGLRITLRI